MPVSNLCRICLTENTTDKEMQQLFEDQSNLCTEIAQRIEQCGGIVLKPREDFPKKICLQCLECLNISYKFRTMCQASEHALRTIIKTELPDENVNRLSIENSGESINPHPHPHPQIVGEEILFEMQTDFMEVKLGEITKLENNYDDEEVEEFVAIEEVDIDELPNEEHLEDDDSSNIESKVFDHKNLVVLSKVRQKFRKKPIVKSAIHSTSRHRKANGTNKAGNVRNTAVRHGRQKQECEPETNICEICGNIYNKRSLLNMHMRRHRAEKPFECEICGKSFTCPSEIGRHIRIHTGEKPYVCRFCGRTFADRSTNIKHERIHTNERPFTCQTCGKSFTYSNVLKNHMLTHTGEKPFPCVPCNKTFSRKHQLDQHLSTMTHRQTVKSSNTADK